MFNFYLLLYLLFLCFLSYVGSLMFLMGSIPIFSHLYLYYLYLYLGMGAMMQLEAISYGDGLSASGYSCFSMGCVTITV